MSLTVHLLFIYIGLLATSIAFAGEEVKLQKTDFIGSESLERWRGKNPAYQTLVVQFAINGEVYPELREMVIRRDGGLMLPVRTLVEIAEGGIYSDSSDNFGFYLESTNRTIDIFPGKGAISSGGVARPLNAEDWAVIDGSEFIAYSIISGLASFNATYREAEGIVDIQTQRPWPREQRQLRELQWARFTNTPPAEKVPSVPLTLSYELLGSPQADISFGLSKDSGGRASSDYSIYAVAEALYMTNVFSLTGSLESGVSNLRMHTERTDPSGSVFGISGLYQFQAGDVTGMSLPIVGSLPSGRGVRLRATPLQKEQGFEQTDISGDGPAGWELELYSNGSLLSVGRIGSDGQYLFRDVPLVYGANSFRVVMYGPYGQTREANFLKNVGESILRSDELHLNAYLVEPGKQIFNFEGSYRAQARGLVGSLQADYGLSDRLTIGAFFAKSSYTLDSEAVNEEKEFISSYYGIEVRPSFDLAAVDMGMVKQVDGGAGLYTRIGFPLGIYSLSSSFNYFGPGFYSSGNRHSFGWVKRRFRLRSSVPLGSHLGDGYAGLSIEKSDLYNNASAILASLSFSHRFGAVYLNHNFDAEHYKNALLRSSSRQIRYRGLTSSRLFDVGLRSELNYQLQGVNQGFQSLGLIATWLLDNGVSFNGAFFYTRGGVSTTELSVSKKIRRALLSMSLIRSDASRYSINAGISFSLGYMPGGGLSVSNDPRTAYSQARVKVFHDVNDNGEFDQAEDELIPNARIVLNGIRQSSYSDDSGVIVLDKLPADVIQDVRIGLDELSDAFLVPKSPSLTIAPRKGQVHDIPFALTEMGEISGRVVFANLGEGDRFLGNVRLQVVSQDGTVFQDVITLGDGYFTFDKIFPGIWTIRLNPQQIDSFASLTMVPKTVRLSKENLIVSDMILLINE